MATSFLNDGNNDLALASFFRTTPSTTTSTTANNTDPWAAVALELNC